MRHPQKWLSIIGIEETGMAGLSREARALLDAAEVIYGGARHLSMLEGQAGERRVWQVPFLSNIDSVRSNRGRRVVVLATGDPQSFGVGALLARNFSADEICTIPARSSFSLAASAIGWPLNHVQCITLHGRAFSGIARHVAPRARLLTLTKDGETPGRIAAYLEGCGFGASRIIVMEHLGGEKERIREVRADGYDLDDVAMLNIVAVECVAGVDAKWHSRMAGLEDDAFVHDGQLTKRVVRAATLSALRPFPGSVLWDVGAGCGSIGIEWMRASDNARAFAIETNGRRCKFADENANRLGVPRLKVICGSAPDALSGLEKPDAVFIGGGFAGKGVFDACWRALGEGGVLVANGVTLESEAMMMSLQREHGGRLTRISVETAEPMGRFKAWKPARTVIQWQVFKRGAAA